MARPTQHRPESILDAARRLFLSDGVHVSTARIATEAGVSNGTLFNHFPTKQSLIDALYVSSKQQLADAIGELDPEEPIEIQMRQVWGRWRSWARTNRTEHTVMTLLFQSGLASEAAQTSGMSALAGPLHMMEQAERQGVFVDLPFDYLAALMQQHLETAIDADLDDEQADIAFSVLWTGIARRTDTRSRQGATT